MGTGFFLCNGFGYTTLPAEGSSHEQAEETFMNRSLKIGIIGAGNIGGVLTRHFTRLGHDVVVANSRGPESLAGLAKETGADLKHGRLVFGLPVCLDGGQRLLGFQVPIGGGFAHAGIEISDSGSD